MNPISFFPLELLKYIAGALPVIEDVLSFSRVSHIFYDAVNSDQQVYQALFLQTYEPPASPRGYDWKTQFRRRHARVPSEDVIKEMIYEARPVRQSPTSIATSANIKALSNKFLRPEDIPKSLDSLLYPLKMIQHALPEGRRAWKRGKLLPTDMRHGSFQAHDILVRYAEESSRIGDFYSQLLSADLEKHGGVSFFVHPRSHIKLEPYALPNFWEGKAKNDGPIPTRWYGGYIQLSYPCQLADLRLNFSGDDTFHADGFDIQEYTIHHGKIGEVDSDGRRCISWIKSYNGFDWAYEGVLDYGGQRMTGVWGRRQNGVFVSGWAGSYGIFMYWAVPENIPNLV